MNKFNYEIELIKPVTEYFKKQDCLILNEIRIGFCRADIVAFKPDETVISVELKLTNWKKAIIQAQNYQLGSDFVYVAFPLGKTYNVLRKASHIFEKEGIGLLGVNELTNKVQKIINAKQSNKKFSSISLYEINKKYEKYKKRFIRGF
jgi:hypothetical protein